MESNPGTFGVTVRRIPPPAVDDDIEIMLTLGDARRLHSILVNGLPSNRNNSIWALRDRLIQALEDRDIECQDLH